MIVLDLEWNQPFGGRRMEEIIQIGAVRLARPGGPVVDAFKRPHPAVHLPKAVACGEKVAGIRPGTDV